MAHFQSNKGYLHFQKGDNLKDIGIFFRLIIWLLHFVPNPAFSHLLERVRQHLIAQNESDDVNYGATSYQKLCLFACFFLVLFPSVALSLTTSATKDLTCLGYRTGTQANCTAGEFTVNPVFSAAPGTEPFCVAGQEFNFKVDLGLEGTNTDRQDIGFFVGQVGNDPRLTTAGNICSVATFPDTPNPWEDNDGDSCGDFDGGGVDTITVDEIKVVCDGDSVGALQIPYLLTYWQNNGIVCTGPGNVINGNKAKCNAGTSSVSGTVSVFSGAYVDVTKQTSPDGDSQPFSFTATGPTGSTVIALTGATLTPSTATGGTYTPATIALATNTTTVSIGDGETARIYINALATSQTLTITETAVTNWESTATISCGTVTGFGSPTLTTNNTTRTMAVELNSTDSAAACTITNTKRSQLTLAKNLTGRIDTTDQFTVAASGGGTLIGTTSATTSGAGTTASTVFYSTPDSALTLTDTKASGPTSLADYETSLTCTNAFTGSGATPATSLPNGLYTSSTSLTPAPGDEITCTFTNTPRPNLTKAFNAGTIEVGQAATLTFTVTNPTGAPSRTGGLTFTDTFPTNLVIAGTPNVINNCGGTPAISATTGASVFSVGGTGIGAAAGASTCTISVDVTSATPLSGYVNGAAQITTISGTLRNSVTNQTLNVVQKPTITVVKQSNGGTDTFSYTGTNGVGSFSLDTSAANPQTSTTYQATAVLTDTTITETIPVGWVLTGASCTNGSSNFGSLTDSTLTIPGANVAYGEAVTCTFTNLKLSTDLAITKAVSNSIPSAGQDVVFTLTVTNNGLDNGSGISVSDLLPTGFTYVSDTPSTGSYDDGTGLWTIGSLANGASATLAITATVNDQDAVSGVGDYTNTATVSGNEVDPDLSDNNDSANINPPSPLLMILKSADRANASPGDLINYTVRVTNTGTGAAKEVFLDDDLSSYTSWGVNTYGPAQPFQLTQLAPGPAPFDSGLTLNSAIFYDATDAVITPVAGPDGFDVNVERWVLPMTGTLVIGGQFRIQYQVKVK